MELNGPTSINADSLFIWSGLAVPTVRYESESLVSNKAAHGTLIRINPREPEVPKDRDCVGLPITALSALQQIQEIYETL